MKDSSYIRLFAATGMIPAFLLGISLGFMINNDVHNSSLMTILAMTILICTLIIGGKRYESILKRLT